MKQRSSHASLRLLLTWGFLASLPVAASAQAQPTPKVTGNVQTGGTFDVLEKLDQLVEQNKQLERQNEELLNEIQVLRQRLVQPPSTASKSNEVMQPTNPSVSGVASIETQSAPRDQEVPPIQERRARFGEYTPNLGFKVAQTRYGDLSVSIYTYVRYLNQLALANSYTNYFGVVSSIPKRQDFQIQKVQIKFLGWLMDPKFGYFLYAWTSNASQGLPAQVVLAGNVNYVFNKYFNLAGGITSLPGTRSVEGNFPFWLSVDSRLIADEYFRPSYTSGIWARGNITEKLRYQAMLGNNLSTLGVSAAQLDNGLNTVASALVWTPTNGDFGLGFGDFEDHDKPAVRLAAHFTRSHETKQSQPQTDEFENTQIRLSDGSIVFTPNLFGPGITVNDLNYQMVAADEGLKYRGNSLDVEYFFRWLNNFGGPGTASLHQVTDQGFQVQASTMAVPKTLQLYLGGSAIFGKYGHPWDTRAGINFFPFKNKVVRWNTEGLYLYNSPVGYTSVPYLVGAHGFVFHTNLELAF